MKSIICSGNIIISFAKNRFGETLFFASGKWFVRSKYIYSLRKYDFVNQNYLFSLKNESGSQDPVMEKPIPPSSQAPFAQIYRYKLYIYINILIYVYPPTSKARRLEVPPCIAHISYPISHTHILTIFTYLLKGYIHTHKCFQMLLHATKFSQMLPNTLKCS